MSAVRDDPPAQEAAGSITLIVRGKASTVDHQAGDTILATARRHSITTPYSCEAGNCATCMAMLREGTVTMRVNDALTAEEVAEGWVLTCQSEPTCTQVTVDFDAY